MMNDNALVSQILGGNVHAFQVLVSRNERLVSYMVAKLVKNREEHEEVCQDVFIKVYDKLKDFNFQSKLSTWIATIAYRHAINSVRKTRMNFQEIPDEEGFHKSFVTEENPENIFEDKDMDQFVLKLIDQLPVQYKLVLTLYHVESMNYSEIGEVTGMPEGTVKNYLFRARNLLKEKVKGNMYKEARL